MILNFLGDFIEFLIIIINILYTMLVKFIISFPNKTLPLIMPLYGKKLILHRNASGNMSIMEFPSVVKKLKEFAPLNLAEPWDNVGVLLEPPHIGLVSKMLLTNDLTLAVMDEAEEKGVDMILSYHPPIFTPLKAIRTAHWKESIVGRCFVKRIAIYSPHTSLDAVEGGVNDWLISAFGSGNVVPVQPKYTAGEWTHKMELTVQETSSTKRLEDMLLQHLAMKKNALVVGTGGEGNTVTLFCSDFLLPNIVSLVTDSGIKTQFAISKLEKVPLLGHGLGRRMTLVRPIMLREAIKATKTHLGLSSVRVAVKHGGTEDDLVRSVAVCAGAGTSVLRGVRADLILTGEMSHHDVLEMTQQGSNVILTEHSNSERGYLSAVLQKKLTSAFEYKMEVIVSEKDADPLKVL